MANLACFFCFGVSMRKHSVKLAMCLAVLVFLPSVCLAAEASDEAVAVAKEYIGLLKEAKMAQAVSDHWQSDLFLTGSFGLMYLEMPEAEQVRSQAAFADFVAAPFESKRLVDLLKTIEIENTTLVEIDASTVAVRLTLDGTGGFRSENTFLLVKTDDGWRIIDQRLNNQPSMRAAIATTYFEHAIAPTDTISVILERAAAETRKQFTAE
jgi:hypothetical protein